MSIDTQRNDGLSGFWRSTWSAWRSGALSTLSQTFVQVAAGEFGDFMKTSADAKNPLIAQCFVANPPRPREFLIGFARRGKLPVMVLTSQRLWMYHKPTYQFELGDYVSIDLAHVAEFRSRSGWNSHFVRVRFKDNTERTYENMADVPADRAVGLAIERCNSPDGWIILAPVVPGTQAGNRPGGVRSHPSNPILEAMGAGALAGLGAGVAAHEFAGGKLTLPIWITAYVLVIANVKNKLVATIVFIPVASLVSVVLSSLDPSN